MKAARRLCRTSPSGWVLAAALAAVGSAGAAEPGGAGEEQAAAAAAVFNHATYSSPIALSADDKLVWSVNPSDGSVAVINAATNALITKVPVGGKNEPQSVALDPANKVAFVANAAANHVAVIKINNAAPGAFNAVVERTITTGAEPWNVVISPDGKRVFVANSGQDTITVIDTVTRAVIGQINLRNSLCNDPDRKRHFQPRGLAVTQDNTRLYVTRFLSFTRNGGKQGQDDGKEGVVCRLNINTDATHIGAYQPAKVIRLATRKTGFKTIDASGDGVPDESTAFPNQLQHVTIRGNKAYLPNIAASPQGPLQFQNSTEAYVNLINGIGGSETDGGSINLHLGARNPEPGKKTLFFANPWAIAFTTQGGAGNAYVVSAASNLLVKLKVAGDGRLDFTVDGDTTRFIDLDDPDDPATSGQNAGKNPQGIAITANGKKAFVMNFVGRNVSVVDLTQDRVVAAVRTDGLPPAGSQEERILVGADMFFNSRGHFNRPPGAQVSTDERLSAAGWQACSSCHFKGWTDGVVWSFASGPRKSVSLTGSFNPHNRNQQKIFNYSAIFVNVQDFEANIRNISGPGPGDDLPCALPPPPTSTNRRDQGLLIGDDGNVNKAPCVLNPFLKDNAGRKGLTVSLPGSATKVQALDALKAWVQLAVRVPNGPLTSNELVGGVPAGQVAQGRNLFQQQCASCHRGGLWSTSVKNFNGVPAANGVACEVALAAGAPAGSFCAKAPEFGDPTGVQYLSAFLKDVGSFNLGVAGQGNPIANNVGAAEKAAQLVVSGTAQAPKDALGLDYNKDGRGKGYNVQSLLGVHAVQPYMHNGACETVACVVGDRKHRTGNGALPDRLADPAKQAAVVRYVEGIDAQTPPFP